MTTEFNELLPVSHDDSLSETQSDRAQFWIIGTCDQVQHLINECYVRKLVSDRLDFTPIVPAPIMPGKYMTVLLR